MKRALQEAEMAFEKDEIPVGAIIVIDNKIIARGHNLTEMLVDVIGELRLLHEARHKPQRSADQINILRLARVDARGAGDDRVPAPRNGVRYSGQRGPRGLAPRGQLARTFHTTFDVGTDAEPSGLLRTTLAQKRDTHFYGRADEEMSGCLRWCCFESTRRAGAQRSRER